MLQKGMLIRRSQASGVVTTVTDLDHASGLALRFVRLPADEAWSYDGADESALLLMSGAARVRVGALLDDVTRDSLFDEVGVAWSCSGGTPIEVQADTDVELAWVQTRSTESFVPRRCSEPRLDRRGRGTVDDAAFRHVITYFDDRSADPASRIVLGEVRTLPGRWSSYPPHAHAQPELYHYRFDRPHGYGHAEHGEEVFRVSAQDTLSITPGATHAQCAAPGYAMYYLWTIRHLDDARYPAPTFAPEHAWTMEPGAAVWRPGE